MKRFRKPGSPLMPYKDGLDGNCHDERKIFALSMVAHFLRSLH